MKCLAAVFAIASLSAGAAPPEQRPVQDLRQSLRQYHTAGTAAPRQLTPVERAELRRQLIEFVPPPAKRRR
jgi:hypothetical protein